MKMMEMRFGTSDSQMGFWAELIMSGGWGGVGIRCTYSAHKTDEHFGVQRTDYSGLMVAPKKICLNPNPDNL